MLSRGTIRDINSELRGLKAQNGRDNIFYEAAMCSHRILSKNDRNNKSENLKSNDRR